MLKIHYKNLTKFAKFIVALLLTTYVFLLLYLTVIKRLYFGTVTGMLFEEYNLNARVTYSINLIPIKTIYQYLFYAPNITSAITNIIGNIAAFVPMGFLVPLVFKKTRKYTKVAVISACSSILIELTQLVLRVGSTDIDDVILNTLGGLLGYAFLYKSLRAGTLRALSERL